MGAVFLLGAAKDLPGLLKSSGARPEWIDLVSWCGPADECPASGDNIPQLALPPSEGADHILLDLTLHLLLGETRQMAAFGCADPGSQTWVLLASAAGVGRYNLLPRYSLSSVLVVPSAFPDLQEKLTLMEIDVSAIDQAIPASEKSGFDPMLPIAQWAPACEGGAAGMVRQVMSAEKSLIIGRQGHTHFLSIWEKV